MRRLYKETVSSTLWSMLLKLMDLRELDNFRLVGGTSLSLQLGHRKSIDIDLFSDSEYGTIDFELILDRLRSEISYVDARNWTNRSMGNSCYIGTEKNKTVKLDLFYTDKFIYPIKEVGTIRLSYLEEIAAMKLEVIGGGGRKKDFWDIHALLDHFSLNEIIEFYLKRNPYSYSKEEMRQQLSNFSKAENDFDPKCLQGKYWELIKLDIEAALK